MVQLLSTTLSAVLFLNCLKHFQVIHLCGKGKLDQSLPVQKDMYNLNISKMNYVIYLPFADIVISRAGANAICELLALCKPNLLIPLSKKCESRGDQILNARSFERQGFSMVLEEEETTKDSLLEAVHKLFTTIVPPIWMPCVIPDNMMQSIPSPD